MKIPMSQMTPTMSPPLVRAPGDMPPEPSTLQEAGLPAGFLIDLSLKHIYFAGEISAQALADALRLPYAGIVETALNFLSKEELAGITGASGFGERGFKYTVTAKGATRAQEIFARSQYSGPAPVPLEQYTRITAAQSIGDLTIRRDQVRAAFDDIVVSESQLRRVGPAANSGRSIFLYGPPGNGKTTIAERISRLLPGEVLIPYAIVADSQIIQVFDALNHTPCPSLPEDPASVGVRPDRRWVRCKRPFIVTGGELTLETLDLILDPVSQVYEAPFQMKANGGMFLIDDFGRQQVQPRDLLNRWIVPLEKRVDYLRLQTGKKIEIPFDVLIVFSTNLAPKDLVDDAFLRRIRHKILVPNPSWEDFRTIFERAAIAHQIRFDEEQFKYLVLEHYIRAKREPKAVHPRDLLDQLRDIARYLQIEPSMTRELIDDAVEAYFVQI
jgi:predicted ATPase with chaperone activity